MKAPKMVTLKIVVDEDGCKLEMNGTGAQITEAALIGLRSVHNAMKKHGQGALFRAVLTSCVNDPKSLIFREVEKDAIIRDEGIDVDMSVLAKLKSFFQPTTEEEDML